MDQRLILRVQRYGKNQYAPNISTKNIISAMIFKHPKRPIRLFLLLLCHA